MEKKGLILLVDDNEDDLILLNRAFKAAGVINPIRELTSGREAIRYLRGEPPFADRSAHPFPSILLLDLNMPDMDGFEVLDWVRQNLPVGELLIIVLTRVEETTHISRAYALGAHSYLVKPGEKDDLNRLISTFRDYWLLRNKSPGKGGGTPKKRLWG